MEFVQTMDENSPVSPNSRSTPREGTKEDAEAERVARELAESERLARQLMEEEATLSAQMQYELLQSASAEMDTVDLVAVQQLLRADEEAQRAAFPEGDAEEEVEAEEDEDEDDDEATEDGDEASGQPTYEQLLELGRRIGDVKAERWAFRCEAVIAGLPSSTFDRDSCGSSGDHMCVFCQCDYEQGDVCRTLPCKHMFHAECVDEWLRQHDTCPVCKQSVVDE